MSEDPRRPHDDDRSELETVPQPGVAAAHGDPPRADETALLPPGALVDGFKIVRLIGRGGMGEVYLARDTRLGRKVALKLVRPSLVGSETAMRRFLLEARATARFSHPHIVTIYAVGDLGGAPYVALEYLEGDTLRERLDAERPSVRGVIRLGLAIAEALAEAHAHGILHRDLKPENVVMPRDGRARVLDFGLARVVGEGSLRTDPRSMDTIHESAELRALQSEGHALCGTPAYMAPEQWRGEEPLPATDVWALGVLLHEALCGRRPYGEREGARETLAFHVIADEPVPLDPALGEAPPALAELVRRCLDKRPGGRPAASELVDALHGLLGARRALDGGDSPFRGLQPFSERHAELFFGRDTEIGAFLERIREEPVMPVVGPSGAGKSSFVHAGVVPRLREGGRWIVLAMRPGRQPFQALAGRIRLGESTLMATADRRGTSAGPGAIRRSTGDPPQGAAEPPRGDDELDLASELRASPPRLGLALQELAERERCRVVLVVDQLEELFALVDDPDDRERFMRALCTAADDPQGPVRVVFTLRDDFLGRLALSPEVRDVLGRVTVIRSPGEEALIEILTRPLEGTGVRYEDPALVDEMIAEVRGEPAALPLLQFAARTMWDRRDRTSQTLTREAYVAMGGVVGALAEHADGVLQGLDPEQVRLAREILLRLVVTRGDGPMTRAVRPLADVLDGLGDGGAEVLRRLSQARLVSVRKGRGGGELELVHESLIRGWRQLAAWIDEGREELGVLAQVEQAADLWERRGRRADEVWAGDALDEARRVLSRRVGPLPSRVAAFLQASDRVENRRQRRRRVASVAAVGVLLAVAIVSLLVAAAFAEREREANRQRAVAESRRAEAQREGAWAAMLRGDPLEARARLRDSLEVEDSPLARALWGRLVREPLRWARSFGSMVFDVTYAPGGGTLAMACGDRAVYLLDAETRDEQVLRGHRDQVYAVDFAPDGRRLASGAWSGEILLWDLETGEARTLLGHDDAVNFLEFDASGARLASGSSDGTVRIWHLDGDRPPAVLDGHLGGVNGVAFSPDGTQLASGGRDAKVRLHDLVGDGPPRELSGHGDTVTNLAYDPTGTWLATASVDRDVRLWDLASGETDRVLGGHDSRVWDVAFSPHGDLLATGCWDQGVRLFPLDGDGESRRLGIHTGGVYTVAFSPDGSQLASGGADHQLKVWDVSREERVERDVGHAAQVMGVAMTPDGTRIASGAFDRTLRVWDRASGEQLAVVHDLPVGIKAVAASPDGRHLATGSWDDARVRVFDLEALDEPPHVVELPGTVVLDLSYDASGDRLACVSGDHRIHVWETSGWRTLWAHQTDQVGLRGLALRGDGRLLATAGTVHQLRLWDLDRGVALARIDTGDHNARGLAFSPDGRWLASAGDDGSVMLWDVEARAGRELGRFDGRIYYIAFHPDGQWVATSGSDGVARLWPVDGGRPREFRGHRDEVNWLAFSPDGRWLATSSDDHTVRVWDAERGEPVWRAPALVGSPPRLLTHRGWSTPGAPPDADAAPAGDEAWRRALQERGLFASFAADRLCLHADGDRLEIWDTAGDTRLLTREVPSMRDVVATPSGCAVRRGPAAELYTPAGEMIALAEPASALAVDGDQLLVASADAVLVFDGNGARLEEHPARGSATAVARIGDELALGYADGHVELQPTAGAERTPRDLEETPSMAPLRLVEGPQQTLLAGYVDGKVGIWNPANGRRLDGWRLHGPIAHLRIDGQRAVATTELGDAMVIDLAAYEADRCSVLRAVWDDVPVIWRDGRPQRQPAPAEHPCSGPTAE